MTTRLHLPVQSITAVRLACRKCGASVSIPLGAVNAPAKCFNCHTPHPGPEIEGRIETYIHPDAYHRD